MTTLTQEQRNEAIEMEWTLYFVELGEYGEDEYATICQGSVDSIDGDMITVNTEDGMVTYPMASFFLTEEDALASIKQDYPWLA